MRNEYGDVIEHVIVNKQSVWYAVASKEPASRYFLFILIVYANNVLLGR